MHSLKQTAVAVILLGLTFALYQVSLTPSGAGSNEPLKSPMADTPSKPDSSLPKADFSPTNSIVGDSSNLGLKTDLPLSKDPAPKLPEAKLMGVSSSESRGIEIPKMPELSSPPSLSFPDGKSPAEKTPPSRSADSSSDDSFDILNNRSAGTEATPGRKPVETVIENGVEKIKYPDMSESDPRSSQIAQREPSASSRDQGLMDALNNQVQPSQPKDTPVAVPEGASQFVTTPVSNQFQPNGGKAEVKSDGNRTESGGQPDPVSKPSSRPRISQADLEVLTYKTVWPKVDELVEAGDFHSALKALSRFYKDENLNGPQRQRLMAWMDALAAKVIFSSEDHLVDQPYVTQANESLADISNRWSVPVKLISNVNGSNLANLNALPAGTQLKQVPGPFHAELKLNAGVITLFLGDLYAGRFSVVVGTSGDVQPGTYEILLKSEQGYKWRDANGKEHPPGTPENHYGTYWMGLSNSLCIHSVAAGTENGHQGCIGLSEKDAADLFSILSEKSTLVIVP